MLLPKRTKTPSNIIVSKDDRSNIPHPICSSRMLSLPHQKEEGMPTPLELHGPFWIIWSTEYSRSDAVTSGARSWMHFYLVYLGHVPGNAATMPWGSPSSLWRGTRVFSWQPGQLASYVSHLESGPSNLLLSHPRWGCLQQRPPHWALPKLHTSGQNKFLLLL